MRVLVAVDNSEESVAALRYTCHLLRDSNAWVESLYVKQHEADVAHENAYAPFVDMDEIREWIETRAEEAEEKVLSSFGVCSEGKVAYWGRVAVGNPAEEILRATAERHYDLIVLGSKGRSSLRGFLLGEVHTKILHSAQQPVLIVGGFRPIQRVLVAYRGAQCDQGALEFTATLLAKRKPEITVLHVQETRESDASAESCLIEGGRTLRRFAYEPTKKMAKGEFVEEILKEVATGRYDLVVLGAYGHKRPMVMKVISDEALRLVQLTSRPVLVYRDQ